MKGSTFKWEVVDDVMITVATTGDVPQAPWDAFIAAMRSKRVGRYLSVAFGSPSINSVQRKVISDLLSQQKIPVAVVTDERLVRGIVTAVSWLGVDIKSFSLSEIGTAMKHLGIADISAPLVERTVEDLRRTL